ncbi:hypothetical protein AC1031_017152 [Aphanomyces cochlioides]|nr:hypothetical protein AC1031_017152 [Aphanomyces cochlioides]
MKEKSSGTSGTVAFNSLTEDTAFRGDPLDGDVEVARVCGRRSMALRNYFLSSETARRLMDESLRYGGRKMVRTTMQDAGNLEGQEAVSVLSYNVMRQMHATPKYKPFCDSSILTATRRKEQIFQELLSYNADIHCLQEVDDYALWWVPRLNAAGYDSIYHQRTGQFDDGLVIAFRRMLFQIFHTKSVNLNDIEAENDNIAAKLRQDNVALLAALQPWEVCRFPSALCVVNVQLACHPALTMVRERQVAYLCPIIEAFNVDFQLPVVFAGSFNAPPNSQVYHTLRTGRPRPAPDPPAKLPRPCVVDPSSSTLTVQWELPPLIENEKDGPVVAFRVDRRVNGNTSVGFSNPMVIEDPAARQVKITMLSAGNTYEFRVAALNQAGWGTYSTPSLPMETLRTRSTRFDTKPLVAAIQDLPQPSPLKLSFGSGKTPRFEDGQIRDDICPRPSRLHGQEAVYDTLLRRGDREDKLLHFEVFESAYERSYLDSEPDFTFADPSFTGTVDYIFYSKQELQARRVLSLPLLESLDGEDVREPEKIPDNDYVSQIPKGWQGAEALTNLLASSNYMGEWSAEVLQVPNPRRKHFWLPNALFASDHLALMAELVFRDEELPVAWN